MARLRDAVAQERRDRVHAKKSASYPAAPPGRPRKRKWLKKHPPLVIEGSNGMARAMAGEIRPPGMEDFSKALERPMKPPPGWRRALGSEQLSRGKAGWLATVVPQEPGKYRVVLVRDFDCADEAMAVVDGIVDA